MLIKATVRIQRSTWSYLLVATLLGVIGAHVACSSTYSCDYNGKEYERGESFPSDDGCNTCSCTESGIECTLMACGAMCTYGDKQYPFGTTFPSEDGCNTCSCSEVGVACTKKACPAPDGGNYCAELQTEIDRQLADIQACTSDSQCGQVLTGTSCGCTRDLVARLDANASEFNALRQSAKNAGCPALSSTCDCPAANGFICASGRCSWNYQKPTPSCSAVDAAQLCVRGTQYSDGEVLKAGDPLKVTVRPRGCWSSSCTDVQEATCSIAQNDAFVVKASFCIADTSAGKPCTADCGSAAANCSFGQPLVAGTHKVTLGELTLSFEVPSQLPAGGLCVGSPWN